MKRTIGILSVLVILTTALMGCSSLNRMFKDEYYVQITGDGEFKVEKADGGQDFKSYNYKLTGFDEKANDKEMEFTATKNLRKDAYLRVYYSDDKGVTSWEEVKGNEVPEKALNKLKENK
ncbi:YxeA family protein [Priestia taiwanensis]|uniref:Membrane protein n=1 Tax=Priestia taiwanensis TaxID=1347902 RepID=A0A917ESH5_9BACI|nr:YxeA family protein [Priestia taiwanensis]MBM7363778.1 uncharacterized protein (TIGR01655 family) [Priestia taiwanensis]GGE74158.1 membrane protein [Priestia taiwanensis]